MIDLRENKYHKHFLFDSPRSGKDPELSSRDERLACRVAHSPPGDRSVHAAFLSTYIWSRSYNHFEYHYHTAYNKSTIRSTRARLEHWIVFGLLIQKTEQFKFRAR